MSRRLDLVLLDTKTALNEAGYANSADLAGSSEVGVYVTFNAGAAAGVVLIETAPASDYTGTWAILATVNWAAATKVHYVALTGAVRAIRARISSAVTSGTVTVQLVANIS
jgi:hypothetical protein